MAAKKKVGKQNFVPLPKDDPRRKPTAAVTSPGKKSTQTRPKTAAEKKAQAVRDAKPRTPIKKADEGFAGSGGFVRDGFALSDPTSKKALINAGLTIAMTPASGQVRNIIAKKLGKAVSKWSGGAAFKASSKGLSGATGMGGKISKTWTPAGQAYRSTIVGTPAQQSARINNLYANADRIANSTAAQARNRTIIGVVKGSQKAGKIGREATAIGVVAANKKKKK